MFSMVLPNTLLFIGLKKSFSNELLASVLFFVLKLMYCFNQGDCLILYAPLLFLGRDQAINVDFCNEAHSLFCF